MGDKAAIDRQIRKIPPTFVHMASWHGGDDEKKHIVRSLDLEGNMLVHCAKFGLKELYSKIGDAQLAGRCRMPATKINNIIGYEMTRAIDKFYGKFALQNRFPIRNLNFEVDNIGMINFIKNGHQTFMKYGKQHDAHTIADCIAYANYHKWNVSSRVIEHGEDFEANFHSSILDIINNR